MRSTYILQVMNARRMVCQLLDSGFYNGERREHALNFYKELCMEESTILHELTDDEICEAIHIQLVTK